MDGPTRETVLGLDECIALLSDAPIGRIVFTDRALPAVVAVTFAVDGDAVVIRTSEDARLARTARDAVLAFEVDDVEPALRSGWSVVVTGRAARVDDPREQRRLARLLSSWAPGDRDVFIRLPLTLVTGRRILPARRHPAAVGPE